MRNALVIVVVGSSLCFAAPNTQAMGFGRTANATQLGQALNFAAMIQLGSDETLGRECVFAEVFSGENKLAPSQVRVTLEPGNEPGERSVRVTSSALIDEPVVTINISVGCNARMSRRFVAFIDPPLLNLAQADAAPPETLAPQKLDSAVAPLLAIVQAASGPVPPTVKLSPPARLASTDAPADAADRPPRAARPAKADRQSTRSAAARNNGSKRTASAANAASARKSPAGTPPVLVAAGAAKAAKTASVSRLQLEPSTAMAERVATAAASAPSAAASTLTPAPNLAAVATAAMAPALAPDSQAELLAIERQRIQRLEEGTAHLIAESKANREALAQVQSRLQAAESERYANPLVYALGVLAALFAGLSVWLWRRQPRAAVQPTWWAAGAEPTSATAALAIEETVALDEAPVEHVVDAVPVQAMAPAESAWEASESLRLPAGMTRELDAFNLTMPAGTANHSVDELIDLEQQAEFFVVLGQDEAATDLLMSHVRSSGSASPMPYLKLLEIYRRCDDRAAYDRIRVRFNRRFDAIAPEWGADLQAGRSLADYPDLLGRLQALWRAPEEVMHALEAALFRRARSDAPVELPAYSELLFLFTIARDLSGRELVEQGADTGGHGDDDTDADADAGDDSMVDLLLPIDDDMTTTRSFASDATPTARISRSAPLDFDLSMPMGLVALSQRAEGSDDLAAVGEPAADASNHIEFNDVPSRPSELAYQR